LASLGVAVHDKGFGIAGAGNVLKLSSPVEGDNHENNSSKPTNASKNTDDKKELGDLIGKGKKILGNKTEEDENKGYFNISKFLERSFTVDYNCKF